MTSLFIFACDVGCRWFPEVQNIFYQGNKRKQVPSIQDQDRLEAFFNCAATLMTEQLQNLALDSLDDYTDLLVQPKVSTRMTVSLKVTRFVKPVIDQTLMLALSLKG